MNNYKSFHTWPCTIKTHSLNWFCPKQYRTKQRSIKIKKMFGGGRVGRGRGVVGPGLSGLVQLPNQTSRDYSRQSGLLRGIFVPPCPTSKVFTPFFTLVDNISVHSFKVFILFYFFITDSKFILPVKPLLLQFCHFSFTFHKVLMILHYAVHILSKMNPLTHTKMNLLAELLLLLLYFFNGSHIVCSIQVELRHDKKCIFCNAINC